MPLKSHLNKQALREELGRLHSFVSNKSVTGLMLASALCLAMIGNLLFTRKFALLEVALQHFLCRNYWHHSLHPITSAKRGNWTVVSHYALLKKNCLSCTAK